jgi:predicted 3-demethylubiquinone-9 3-methyltransferase (glyoxalase superfamily)
MVTTQRISPCLWFADEAEQAARFYAGMFKNSRITMITRYGTAGFETHHRPAGSVMTVEFELDGQSFTALNGGPVFKFNEAGSDAPNEKARHRQASSSARWNGMIASPVRAPSERTLDERPKARSL